MMSMCLSKRVVVCSLVSSGVWQAYTLMPSWGTFLLELQPLTGAVKDLMYGGHDAEDDSTMLKDLNRVIMSISKTHHRRVEMSDLDQCSCSFAREFLGFQDDGIENQTWFSSTMPAGYLHR
jgi:hypothetical protein